MTIAVPRNPKADVFRERDIERFVKRGREIAEGRGDGRKHRVEVWYTEFYGPNPWQRSPHSFTTLLVDGELELGGKMDRGSSRVVAAFDCFAPPKERRSC